MKKLGIIGGMGPLATQLLYKEIIEKTDAKCDQEHIDMVILNHASMPDRTKAIMSGDTKTVLELLKKDVAFLENANAEAIAIPCNTSHYFFNELQAYSNIPIINMVRETVLKVIEKNPDCKKIAILATDGTIFTGIYKRECELNGVEAFEPDKEHQKLVMNIIYEQIKKGLPGSDDDFERIDKHLKENGCDGAILACTELSCYAKQGRVSDFYTDALDVLCEKAIEACGGRIK